MPIVLLLILGGLFLAASSKPKKKALTPMDPEFWQNPGTPGPSGTSSPGWPSSKSASTPSSQRTWNGQPVGPLVELKPATDRRTLNLSALAGGLNIPSAVLTAQGTGCIIYLDTLAQWASIRHKAQAAIIAGATPPMAVADNAKLIIVTSDGKFWWYGGTKFNGWPADVTKYMAPEYCAYHLSSNTSQV